MLLSYITFTVLNLSNLNKVGVFKQLRTCDNFSPAIDFLPIRQLWKKIDHRKFDGIRITGHCTPYSGPSDCNLSLEVDKKHGSSNDRKGFMCQMLGLQASVAFSMFHYA